MSDLYICPVCVGRSFRTADSFVTHMGIEHPEATS